MLFARKVCWALCLALIPINLVCFALTRNLLNILAAVVCAWVVWDGWDMWSEEEKVARDKEE